MSSADGDQDGEWVDDEAGPLVRPFAMTRGRTQPVTARFDVVTMVTAIPGAADDTTLMPEHYAIIELCPQPLSVAEIAAHLKLPLGTVRVLLDELLQRGLIRTATPSTATEHIHDRRFLEALLNGLQAL